MSERKPIEKVGRILAAWTMLLGAVLLMLIAVRVGVAESDAFYFVFFISAFITFLLTVLAELPGPPK